MEEACRFGVATTSQRRRVAWARRPAGRPVEGRRELGVVAYLACPPAMPAGLSDTLVPYHSALSGLRDVMRRAAAGSLSAGCPACGGVRLLAVVVVLSPPRSKLSGWLVSPNQDPGACQGSQDPGGFLRSRVCRKIA
jgi:hypothetical protein